MVNDEKTMTKVSKKALAGEPFSDLVATYSESPDKDNNGEIGLLEKRRDHTDVRWRQMTRMPFSACR
jgi:parvulin-like peptidyl-prolyl isomerase